MSHLARASKVAVEPTTVNRLRTWGIPEYNALTDVHSSEVARRLLGNKQAVKRLRKAGIIRKSKSGELIIPSQSRSIFAQPRKLSAKQARENARRVQASREFARRSLERARRHSSASKGTKPVTSPSPAAKRKPPRARVQAGRADNAARTQRPGATKKPATRVPPLPLALPPSKPKPPKPAVNAAAAAASGITPSTALDPSTVQPAENLSPWDTGASTAGRGADAPAWDGHTGAGDSGVAASQAGHADAATAAAMKPASTVPQRRRRWSVGCVRPLQLQQHTTPDASAGSSRGDGAPTGAASARTQPLSARVRSVAELRRTVLQESSTTPTHAAAGNGTAHVQGADQLMQLRQAAGLLPTEAGDEATTGDGVSGDGGGASATEGGGGAGGAVSNPAPSHQPRTRSRNHRRSHRRPQSAAAARSSATSHGRTREGRDHGNMPANARRRDRTRPRSAHPAGSASPQRRAHRGASQPRAQTRAQTRPASAAHAKPPAAATAAATSPTHDHTRPRRQRQRPWTAQPREDSGGASSTPSRKGPTQRRRLHGRPTSAATATGGRPYGQHMHRDGDGGGGGEDMTGMYAAVAMYESKLEAAAIEAAIADRDIRQHRAAIHAYRQQLGAHDAVQANERAIARLSEVITRRIKTTNTRAMALAAKAADLRRQIDDERREIMLLREERLRIQADIAQEEDKHNAIRARVKATSRKLYDAQHDYEDELEYFHHQEALQSAEVERLTGILDSQPDGEAGITDLLKRARAAAEERIAAIRKKRGEHLASGFDHTSEQAKVKAAQRRLKRLVDAFAAVSAAVPGVSCPEHLHSRYVDLRNQITALTDQIHGLRNTETLQLIKQLRQVRATAAAARQQVPMKRLAAIERAAEDLKAAQQHQADLHGKNAVLRRCGDALVAGVGWLLGWLEVTVASRLDINDPTALAARRATAGAKGRTAAAPATPARGAGTTSTDGAATSDEPGAAAASTPLPHTPRAASTSTTGGGTGGGDFYAFASVAGGGNARLGEQVNLGTVRRSAGILEEIVETVLAGVARPVVLPPDPLPQPVPPVFHTPTPQALDGSRGQRRTDDATAAATAPQPSDAGMHDGGGGKDGTSAEVDGRSDSAGGTAKKADATHSGDPAHRRPAPKLTAKRGAASPQVKGQLPSTSSTGSQAHQRRGRAKLAGQTHTISVGGVAFKVFSASRALKKLIGRAKAAVDDP